MSEHRYYHISPRIWEQPWDDDTRMLAFYLLTCRHRTVEGLFKLPKAYIAEDMNWTVQRLAKPFSNLLDEDFIRYDEQAKVILIVKALEYQKPINGNQVTAGSRKLDDVPATPLFGDLLSIVESLAYPLLDPFADSLRHRIANTPTPTSNSNSIHGGSAEAETADAGEPSPEQSVLDAWNEAWTPIPWPQKKRMTEKRRAHIHARLQNFSVEDLAQAAFNLRQSPHHTGQNERGWVADPEFLFREDGQVERWLHPAKAAPSNGRAKLTPQQENIANLPLLGKTQVIDLDIPP